jgi:hypothetical protein
MGSFAERQEEVELLGEEIVVGAGVQAKQRKGFAERSSPDHQFGAALGDEIHGRELLEDPHRVGGAQDRHRARQPDLAGARGGRGQDDRWRGIEELGAMVLANAEDVETDPSATSTSLRSSAIRSLADGRLPVSGSGRMAAKLSIPISMESFRVGSAYGRP